MVTNISTFTKHIDFVWITVFHTENMKKLTSLSSLMLVVMNRCNETVRALCYRGLAINAAFTPKRAHWANNRSWAPSNAREIPDEFKKRVSSNWTIRYPRFFNHRLINVKTRLPTSLHIWQAILPWRKSEKHFALIKCEKSFLIYIYTVAPLYCAPRDSLLRTMSSQTNASSLNELCSLNQRSVRRAHPAQFTGDIHEKKFATELSQKQMNPAFFEQPSAKGWCWFSTELYQPDLQIFTM